MIKATTSIKPFLLFLCALFALTLSLSGCAPKKQKPGSMLFFGARVGGPAINYYAFDHKEELDKLAENYSARDRDLDVSRDGKLVFTSNRNNDTAIRLNRTRSSYKIFLLDPKASLHGIAHTEVEATDTLPKISPDSSKIAFIRAADEKQNVMLVASDPKAPAKVLLSSNEIHYLDWSEDGNKLAIAYSDQTASYLSVLTLASNKQENLLTLPNTKPADGSTPASEDNLMKRVTYLKWSPDGQYIAYIRSPIYDGDRELRLINVKNKKDTRLSATGAHTQNNIDWSGDSQSLLYSAITGYNFYFNEETQRQVYEGAMHIYQYTLDGKTKQLTSGDHLYNSPTFSPDEKYIAFYYADKLGERTYSLNIMKANGSDIRELYKDGAPGSQIFWQ